MNGILSFDWGVFWAALAVLKRKAIFVLALLTLLTLCLSAQKAERPKRPIYFGADGNGFFATGKWVPADPRDKPGFPSETEIDCFKPTFPF